MPFPLAHPAAVLPLRRYCSRYLSFAALVIGSVTPDAGYCFGEFHAGEFSHRFIGSLGFCLPVGLLMLGALYFVRLPAVKLLPERQQRMFLPLCRQSFGGPLVVVTSLLIGAWTHLLWDSFTHKDGWFVDHLDLLQAQVVSISNHTVRVCHLLWYGSSFAGIVWLFLAFEKWKQAAVGERVKSSGKEKLQDAVMVALFVLPIEVLHHLVHGALGLYLVAIFSLCVIIGVVVGIRRGHAL